jgi:hypothetical protein
MLDLAGTLPELVDMLSDCCLNVIVQYRPNLIGFVL